MHSQENEIKESSWRPFSALQRTSVELGAANTVVVDLSITNRMIDWIERSSDREINQREAGEHFDPFLVALRWEDLNWDAQTLTVWRGKQGQHSIVPIRPTSPDTLNSLRRLLDAQQSVRSYDDMPFRHIFTALKAGMNARVHSDKDARAITQTIRQVVKHTAEKAGLGTLSSSDLRHASLCMFSQAEASRADIIVSAAS